MAVDTSISPYFDDFNESKNFVKVLYKPGVAVQARELTQSQSILQNQIKTVGNFLFKDGAKVKGPKPSVNLNCRTVKLKPNDAQGRPLNLDNLLNTFVTTRTSGGFLGVTSTGTSGSTVLGPYDVLGFVEFVYSADDPNIGDPPSIVISLKKFDSINDGMFDPNTELNFYTDYTDALLKATPNYTAVTVADTTKNASTSLSNFSTSAVLDSPTTSIRVGDLLVHPRLRKKIYVTSVTSTTQLELSDAPGITFGSENVSYVNKATNPTSILTQDDATFYKSGFFVKSNTQKIVPDKDTQYPTKLIAFLSDQQIITSNDDSTLLDPALESSNYLAPGADRLKLDLNLTSLDVVEGQAIEDSKNLIPLIFFNRGKIEYIAELSNDSDLDRKLAERTYDESGSYVVTPFQISPEHTLETDTNLSFLVSPGKAYVGGMMVRTVDSTRITIPKPTTLETKTNLNVNTTYGNYFRIKDIKGSLTNPADLEAASMFLELHNVTNPTSNSSVVGTIAFKNLEYDTYISGDSPEYKIFYYSYSPTREAPTNWDEWSRKYNISAADGYYISQQLYENNNLLGNFGPTKAPFYGLYREPDTAGVAFWYTKWVENGRDIEKIKEAFVFSPGPNDIDYTRVRTNSKTFLVSKNNSIFYDGILNVAKIKSIVGVSNELTNQGTAATYGGPFFSANISSSGIALTGATIIFDKDRPSDGLIFPINKNYVKQVNRISTIYNKVITNAVFTGGVFSTTVSLPETFALGDGNIPASTARLNFTVLVKTGATANIKLGAFNFERGNVIISGDSATLTINVDDAGFTGLADIGLTIENDGTVPRVKTLVTNQAKLIDIKAADTKYSLMISDIAAFGGIHKIQDTSAYLGTWSASTSYDYDKLVSYNGTVYKSVRPSLNVSPQNANTWAIVQKEDSSNYILDNGQRDNFYDHGTISYIGSGSPPGNVVVTFEYFSHSGSGPIVAQSYPAETYSRIPTYRSVINAAEYKLRDCLDFRPRRIDNSDYQDFAPAIIPNSSVLTEVDVTYYIGRKDKIYVTNTLQNFTSPYNKFYLEIGKETSNPIEPGDTSDLTKLSIATIEIPPYAVNSFDVKIVYEDNKRFTMRDIGKIENLTIELNKAVKLQSIEIAILKSATTDDNGEALLKSGILVEDFKDFNVADLTSGYFSAAIDTEEGECFPSFGVWNVDMGIIEDSDIFMFNDIITKKYTEELYVSNLEANNEIFVNPGGIDDGRGRAEISKKNSLRVNLLLSGGLLLAGAIAYKTATAIAAKATFGAAVTGYSDYALIAAYQGESTLAIAWGAAKELAYPVLDAFKSIDGIMSVVSWPYKAAKVGLEWIYNSLTGSGASSVVPGAYGSTSLGAALFGDAAWASASEGASLVARALSNIFNQPFGATIGEVSTGLGFITSAAVTYTWGGLSVAANSVAAATSGVPIVGAATAAVAEGIAGAYSWVLSSGPLVQIVAVAAVVAGVVAIGKAIWRGLKRLFSDVRMKENIVFKKKMPNGLNLYEFDYKKEFKQIAGYGRYEGYIAQEVEKKYPNAVQIESNGYRSINYSLIGT